MLMVMMNPDHETANFSRIRVAVILHLQLWPAKLTRKSSEIGELCYEMI